MVAFDATREDVALALALARRALACASGGVCGWHRARPCCSRLREGRPLFLMLDGDVAQTLGAILRDELAIKNEFS